MEKRSKIVVGTAGWSYKDWNGIFYPDYLTSQKIHPLEYLAQYFDVVEVNTSFYGPLKPELAKIWCRRVAAVNPRFVFTAKLYRSFTHSPLAITGPTSAATIRPEPDDEAKTREGLDALASEGKLGALLIQFPISYKNSSLNREYIEELLQRFEGYPCVVEVRHDTWDNPDSIAHFARMGVGFCNIDQPQIGRSLEPTEHVTSPIGYIRLHGRNYEQWFDSDSRDDRYNYLYNAGELAQWKDKIDAVAQKARLTYVIANNHYEAKAGVNALQLKNLLTGHRVKAPEPLLRRYPDLKKIADIGEEDRDPNLSLLA
jgi:uncharacterized protein YecE (DUF72 family)